MTSERREPSGAAVFSTAVTDAITDAAIDALVEHGYAKLSMEGVFPLKSSPFIIIMRRNFY